MAWEWVAPVVTGSVALGGIWATYRTGAKSRESAERVGEAKNAHDRDMAYESRLQQRRAEAYVELLTVVEEVDHWVKESLAETVDGVEGMDPPDVITSPRPRALIYAYGSAAALVLFDAWQHSVSEFRDAFYNYTWNAGECEKPDPVALQRRMETTRMEAGSARKVLIEELAAELNGTRRIQSDLQISSSAASNSPQPQSRPQPSR